MSRGCRCTEERMHTRLTGNGAGNVWIEEDWSTRNEPDSGIPNHDRAGTANENNEDSEQPALHGFVYLYSKSDLTRHPSPSKGSVGTCVCDSTIAVEQNQTSAEQRRNGEFPL